MKNYYVFLCLDNVPFLELILNSNKRAISNYEMIDWQNTKYIILNFKSNIIKEELIQKGTLLYNNKVLTKQLIYYQINIEKAHKKWKEKTLKISKKNYKIIELSEKLFYEDPTSFIEYIKEKKLFNKSEMTKFEETLKIWNEENEMLKSWQILKEQKK